MLVNNSGATWGEDLETYPDSAWTKLMTLNVQRVFTLTQKLLPMIEAAGKRDGVGRVINVSPSHGGDTTWLLTDRIDRIDQRCQCAFGRDIRLLGQQSRFAHVSKVSPGG